MELPDNLINIVKDGHAVLFLGAGASLGCTSDDCSLRALSAGELRDSLSDQFLSGKYKDDPLSYVAGLAIDYTTRAEVERYIKQLLSPLEPSSSHLLIPDFTWRAIVTTNYDTLIETAYRQKGKGDKIHRTISDEIFAGRESEFPGNVELIKLHGCIENVPSSIAPLVISNDQYSNVSVRRERPFARVSDFGTRYSFIMVGTKNADPDIIACLRAVPEDMRQRFYLIIPDPDSTLELVNSRKNITLIKGTFGEFMNAIDLKIPKKSRVLGQLILQANNPIQSKVSVHGEIISLALDNYLTNDLWYISKDFTVAAPESKNFFLGASTAFQGHSGELVFERDVELSLLVELITDADEQRSTATLIKGGAGSGKSILLQSLALRLSKEENTIVIYVRNGKAIPLEGLKEILALTSDRVFLFVDNAADYVSEIHQIQREFMGALKKLSLVLADRGNEVFESKLLERLNLDRDLELKKLSKKEAKLLLDKLDSSSQLGFLANLSFEDQVKSLISKSGAGGDVLVSVYNSTHGRSLEDQIADEYEKIAPNNAKRIYLTVCILQKFGQLVRAGTIHRIHRISFDRFKDEFFEPLQQIVFTEEDNDYDIYFRARHPVVADLVFAYALSDEGKRADAILECVKGLESGFSSDERALDRLINHDTVHQLFPTREVALVFLEKLVEKLPDNAVALHQAAVYAFTYGSDLEAAQKYLERAEKCDPNYHPIKHSLCHVHYKKAVAEQRGHVKSILLNKVRDEAKKLTESKSSPYPFDTLVLILCTQINEALESGSSLDNANVIGIIEEAENTLTEAHGLFPSDSRIDGAESRFAFVLGDSERVITSLYKAIQTNPLRGGARRALCRILINNGDFVEAIKVLRDGLEKSKSDIGSIIMMCEIALQYSVADVITPAVRALLARNITKNNWPKAEILLARIDVELGDFESASKIFQELRTRHKSVGRRWKLFPLAKGIDVRIDRVDSFSGAYAVSEEVGRVFIPRTTRGANHLHKGQIVNVDVSFSSSGAIATKIGNLVLHN